MLSFPNWIDVGSLFVTPPSLSSLVMDVLDAGRHSKTLTDCRHWKKAIDNDNASHPTQEIVIQND